MMDKLKLINIGDTVEYRHEGALLHGLVHGWKLWANTQHCALVGGTFNEQRIPLDRIVARERLVGKDSGIVTF